MTPSEVTAIVKQCSYKPNWTIIHSTAGNYIQLYVENTLDSVTGELTHWRSGKRYLSPFMCRQEIVGVIFDLIKAAEMHELHEWFRYKGASIYNPHLDPDALVEVARKKGNFNYRQNAMTMQESTDDNDN
jgi:hypothetical protein